MVEVMDVKQSYPGGLTRLDDELPRDGRPWLARLRKNAVQRFREAGFPTARDEDWKFTNVSPIVKVPFRPAAGYVGNGLVREKLQANGYLAEDACRLVFVNGRFAPELSQLRPLSEGVMAASLAEVLEQQPEWLERHLGRHADFSKNAFTALNTALWQDGAFLMVPAGRAVREPVHVLYVTTATGEASVTYPRSLVVVDTGGQLTLVERYVGLEDELYLTNAVTEFVVGPDAVVDHYKLQQESDEAYHVANTQVRLERGSRFASHYISFGGAVVRNEARALLAAEHGECTLNGLYLASERQHIDNFTVIDHAMPNCASHELYKGILDGHAHGVFNGKIFVRQDAQQTDAKQTNQTLLLSDDAVIDTKPQLEIFADDVKCTHGATVGQLRDEAIFYLRSRGIGREAARSLLTYAFANDIVSRVRVPAVRAELEEFLLARQHLPVDRTLTEGAAFALDREEL
jgi:Fe-S cluster assembly protein SufD